MRLAWFSPLPPDSSGIAAYTHEVVPLLRPHFRALDLYTGGAPPRDPAPAATAYPAHDFPWRHRRAPYDLIVYQMGNSAAHDFIWAYLFRYPGLLVLHDAQIHQARALWLLRRLEPRLDDYLAEFRASHPAAPPDAGRLFAAGLGGTLFRLWPMVRLIMQASRLTAVHNAHLAAALTRKYPETAITAIDMGVADPGSGTAVERAAQGVRAHLGIPSGACVVGAYGGITPEKRIPQLLEAMATLGERAAHVHLLLVGHTAAHYDLDADVTRFGLGARVHVTGYVADEALPAHLAAADVSWCLRWPSNGETSASWLRCLGAGRPTLTTALAQLADVPALGVGVDAQVDTASADAATGIAIDPLDEARELPPALAALIDDAGLRARLGANARRYWEGRHTLPRMADAYRGLIADAAARPAPSPKLPPHLLDDATGTARRLLGEMGLPELPW